ncbi:hypothetical protein FACS1894110_21980 [Spirochaetia bacterium]|nr:hypothetical protein FACS1894110_21980 [Spirochaetia bacterium]
MNFSRLKAAAAKFPRLMDAAVLFGWMAGLFLIGWGLWTYTEPVRGRLLQKAVNQVMANMDEPLQLNGVLEKEPVKRIPLGKWYSISGSADRILVFSLISGGAALPCGAVVNQGGKVERVIPLGVHGEQLFKNLPQGVLRVYIHRIEAELALWGEEK